ncbi:MAG: site-2 protease family protein [Planctomycetota bacterium]|nr:site-2 protease family protein [Planctomycetota bacterium]
MLNRPLLPLLFTVALGAPVLAAMGGGFGWIWAVLGISFLIAVHEWGHYMACVLTKTRTETFSIGFGPRLFGWERARDGTRRFTVGSRQLDPIDHAMDFRIALVPLGGYVKMAGGEIIGESTSTDPNEFVNKSASARIFIISAGVIMNVITAFFLYSLAFQFGKPVRQPIFGTVVPGGPAWRAGIEPGDEVIDVGGTKPRSWLDVRMEIVLGDQDERIPLRVKRGEEELDLKVLPVYQTEGGYLEIQAGHAVKLTLGEGEDALHVGYSQPATVNGWPVRGGAEAHEAVTTAFRNGAAEVVVATADGRSKTVRLAASEDTIGEEAKPAPKIGLEPFLRFTVSALRSNVFEALKLDDVLRMGDELRAIVSGGKRYPIESPSTLSSARQIWPLDAVVVFRDDKETTLETKLATAQDVRRFYDALGLEASTPNNRVRPLEAGHLFPTEDGIWRYPTSPAREAGMDPGDAVLKVGDTKTADWNEVLTALQKGIADGPVELTVRGPDDAERSVTLEAVALAYAGDVDLTLTEREPIQLDGGFGEALALGFKSTGREIGNVFRTIGGLFSGSISFNKNIAGPITLIRASKQQSEAGPSSLMWFLAYISVMLAVLNILPIPVLDGGHLLFILIEKVKGSPLNEAVAVKAMYIGLFLLLTLMFFAFKNDITRLF